MSTEVQCWEIEYQQRPWTTNKERTEHHMTRAKRVKEWREAFAWLARAQRIPPLVSARIAAKPWQKGGVLQDVAACNPAVKAAIDGLVDAGVLPDDSPAYLTSVEFFAPEKGRDALTLYVYGEPIGAR